MERDKGQPSSLWRREIYIYFLFSVEGFAGLVQLLFRGAIHPRILVGPPVGCSSTLDDPISGVLGRGFEPRATLQQPYKERISPYYRERHGRDPLPIDRERGEGQGRNFPDTEIQSCLKNLIIIARDTRGREMIPKCMMK
jgi:hypothetical protein